MLRVADEATRDFESPFLEQSLGLVHMEERKKWEEFYATLQEPFILLIDGLSMDQPAGASGKSSCTAVTRHNLFLRGAPFLALYFLWRGLEMWQVFLLAPDTRGSEIRLAAARVCMLWCDKCTEIAEQYLLQTTRAHNDLSKYEAGKIWETVSRGRRVSSWDRVLYCSQGRMMRWSTGISTR